MSLRNTLWISALALGSLVVPASASGTSTQPPSTPPPTAPGNNPPSNHPPSDNPPSNNPPSNNPPSTPPTPATFTRTYVFPPFGLASSFTSGENARISVLNIAQTSHHGIKASCSGSISFANGNGDPVGKPVSFTDLSTGQIAAGDVIGLSPGSSSIRNEFQGAVQITVTAGSLAPCSLLLTLEVYDAQSGATHSLVTAAVEQPVEVDAPALGRRH